MKIGANTTQGSFGMPAEMKAALDTYSKGKDVGEKAPEADIGAEPLSYRDPQAITDEDLDGSEDQMSPDKIDPIEQLEKDFDIQLEDDDFQKLIFKGFLEKDVVALPPIRGAKPLIVTFKTLTGDEYDLVDELLAEDIRDSRMTTEGFNIRRGMWVISVGITKIQGKQLCQPEYMIVGDKKEFDIRATTRKKRDVIGKLSGSVLSRLMRIHAQLTLTLNAVIEDPSADYIKKP